MTIGLQFISRVMSEIQIIFIDITSMSWYAICPNFYEKYMFLNIIKNYDKPRQHIKKQRHHFAGQGP